MKIIYKDSIAATQKTLLLLYKHQTVIVAAYCGSQTTFDRARGRECCSGGLVTGAGRQTAWKRNLPHCDTAVGIVCVCVCVCGVLEISGIYTFNAVKPSGYYTYHRM